jgi:UDPglucose 6-dehydrogenase
VEAAGGDVAGKRIAVLGIAFKPETDDVREAPSLPLIAGLVAAGANVVAFDPEAMAGARALLPAEVEFAEDASAAIHNADALVIVTEWNEFRALEPTRLVQLMRGRVLVDLRNIFDPGAIRAAGLEYHGIGRGRIDPG